MLDKKPQQIVGGPTNNEPATSGPPVGKDPASAALLSGKFNMVIGYCSSAKSRPSQTPELQVAKVPPEISAGPESGLATLDGADPHPPDLALFMLSPGGQQIFALRPPPGPERTGKADR